MKLRKWWLIPVAILLVLLVFAGIFRNTLMLYIAPKTVLSAALTDTVGDIKAHFDAGPLPILLQGMDPQGKNTLDLQLTKASPLIGDAEYDMQLQMEQAPRRILARGQVRFQQKNMDLSVFLDGTCAAISSAELLQGRYYGLTYDSFARDLGENGILRLLIDQQTITQWQSSVLALQSFMNRSIPSADLSQLDVQKLILGIMALKAEVEQEELVWNGSLIRCHEISFETTGYEVRQGLQYLQADIPVDIDQAAEISVSFWMSEGDILQIELTVDSAAEETEITLVIDEKLQLLIRDSRGYRSVTAEVAREDGLYRGIYTVDQVLKNESDSFRVDYIWDPGSGDLQVSTDAMNRQGTVALTLMPEEKGFTLQTGDFEGLMHMLLGTTDNGDSRCSVTVTQGAEVTTPEYKNFDQWSMEDLLTLISGLGGLLGLQVK